MPKHHNKTLMRKLLDGAKKRVQKIFSGMTGPGKKNGHTHSATTDDSGNGVTSTDDGHKHEIVKFKVQMADGHDHTLPKDNLTKT